jgi:hypothetical protein
MSAIDQLITHMHNGRLVRDDRGAAETSTIFAWIVVGVLVVMGLLGAFTTLGADVIDWIRDQLGI